MKITRRAVLRLTGAAAASLALSSCSASGSAILGSNFSSWLQQTLGISSSGAASSAASSEAMVASSPAAGEQPAASLAALPAYDADPLTGEAKRSNGRIVGVMVQESTFWMTVDNVPYPHQLVIDLSKVENVTGFRYLPRAEKGYPGMIKEYRVYVKPADFNY